MGFELKGWNLLSHVPKLVFLANWEKRQDRLWGSREIRCRLAGCGDVPGMSFGGYLCLEGTLALMFCMLEAKAEHGGQGPPATWWPEALLHGHRSFNSRQELLCCYLWTVIKYADSLRCDYFNLDLRKVRYELFYFSTQEELQIVPR